jgi:hypothetical protein
MKNNNKYKKKLLRYFVLSNKLLEINKQLSNCGSMLLDLRKDGIDTVDVVNELNNVIYHLYELTNYYNFK